ncbi:translocation protein [Cylindrobasidium torrendii FP15055 ss-10]|uniref:Translocation protein SEC62 n=1 Tax=Cylindrobasidium torrendii FP15055 ss-10 TaxID=1314674 RepID=A0A0D7BC51_9AGAR|nr:translocation protein [Cylindrobasidium torrendii FP15055 ss-10]
MEQQAKAPADIKKVADFLRGNVKPRSGALNGKRVDYFKGKSAAKSLLTPAYAKKKGVPKVENEEGAHALLRQVHQFAFFIRVQRGGPSGTSAKSPKTLQVVPQQLWGADEYYAWFYEGSQWTNYLGGVALVVVMLAGVCFPLWPPVMRQGVWYLSVGALGLLGLLFVIAILRLIFYIITVLVASPGIWVFPNLFADVGFIESFIPFWEWDLPKKKKGKKGTKKGVKEDAKTSALATPPQSDASRPSTPGRVQIEEVEDTDS